MTNIPPCSILSLVQPDIPPGGEALSAEIVRYDTSHGHWYLTTEALIWHKGLTTILKNDPMDEGLIKYIASHGGYEAYKKALAEAGLRGTNVHRAIARLLSGEQVHACEHTQEEARHLVSFLRFCANYKLETGAVEQPIWDSRRQIATCLDWRGLMKGRHTIANWKTGKSVYDVNLVQVNEEAILFNGMGRFDAWGPVEQTAVVRTNPQYPSKYQVVLQEINQRRHEYFECLYNMEVYHDQRWAPELPKPLPKVFGLRPPKISPPANNGKPYHPDL